MLIYYERKTLLFRWNGTVHSGLTRFYFQKLNANPTYLMTDFILEIYQW
jgi:hypothetical protein